MQTFFSILEDETQDVSRLEQMPFYVRYVDGISKCIMEDILEFSIVHDMTGTGLSTSILQLLEKFGLENKCRIEPINLKSDLFYNFKI